MSELQQQIDVLRRRQRKLLVVTAVVLVVFYFGVYRTAIGQLDRTVQQVHIADGELKINKQQIDALPKLAQEVQRLRNELARSPRELPQNPDMSKFWVKISQLSEKLSLRAFYFERQQATTIPLDGDTAIGVLPVRITFEGNFSSGFEFLRQMESFPRLLHVQKTFIRSLDPSGDVSFELWVNLYYRTDANRRS